MVIKKKVKKPNKPEWYIFGRPTKYNSKYAKDMVEYFERCQAEIMVDVKFFQPNKNTTISTILNPLNNKETLEAGNVKEIAQKLVMQRFPTIIRFARMIWVAKSTIYKRAEDHKDFSDALSECSSISEAILLENWLQWTYNPQFAMFLLKNNHWYKDKSEVDQNIKWELKDIKTISVFINDNEW